MNSFIIKEKGGCTVCEVTHFDILLSLLFLNQKKTNKFTCKTQYFENLVDMKNRHSTHYQNNLEIKKIFSKQRKIDRYMTSHENINVQK